MKIRLIIFETLPDPRPNMIITVADIFDVIPVDAAAMSAHCMNLIGENLSNNDKLHQILVSDVSRDVIIAIASSEDRTLVS